MMKRLILTLMIAGLMAPAGLYAQKVYTQNGKAILDLTEAAGMPADAVTDTSKTSVYQTFNPSDAAFGKISGVNNDHAHPINATVYQKLEISLVEPGKYNWVNAFNYCRNLNQAGGSGWRLPTQRELILIYIFRPALESIFNTLGGTAFFPEGYWSSAEDNATGAWAVNIDTGFTYDAYKTGRDRVRCVREISQ